MPVATDELMKSSITLGNMKHTRKRPNHWIIASRGAWFALSLMACTTAYGEMEEKGPETSLSDLWTLKVMPQLTYTVYNNSRMRDRMRIGGVYVDAQYLEKGGFTVGVTHTELQMKGDAPTLRQDNGYLSGRLNFTPDLLPGRLTLRMGLYLADNNDATNESNGVRVFAPQLSFLNLDHSRYFDLGYAHSSYDDSIVDNGSLSMDQWTPTVGVSFNQGYDWLQLRGYIIHYSNALRAQNRSSSISLEAKWTHYPAPSDWMPKQILAGVLLGRRLYAVDGDSGSVYNMADMQLGGVLLGAQWKLASKTNLLVQGGHDRYEELFGEIATKYSSSYLYTGLITQW